MSKIYNVKEKHLLLAKELINVVQSNSDDKTITYGELSKRIDKIIIPIAMGKPLGVVSNICRQNGMPLITALVYGKSNKTKLPSEGFYYLFFRDIMGNKEEEYQVYIHEMEKIKEYKNWNKLLEIIDENVQP